MNSLAPHLTQFRHPLYNPQGEISSNNCGPASLALVQLLLGNPLNGHGQRQIDRARYLMFAQVDRRRQCLHPTSRGYWRDEEAGQSVTDLCDIQRGAQRLGLCPVLISDLDELSRPYQGSRMGILAGTPSDSQAYRQLLGISEPGGHFVVLLQNSHQLHIWDPLSSRPHLSLPFEVVREFAARKWFSEGYGSWLFPENHRAIGIYSPKVNSPLTWD